VDRFTVWRYGSAAIWLGRDAARVLTDRWDRGDRPWVQPVPKPRTAARPTLPQAAVDGPDVITHPVPVDRDERPWPAPEVAPAEP
jgi:competence protein ComEC